MAVPLDPRQLIDVARQPMLDADRRVHGYALLYRAQGTDQACSASGDLAAARVVTTRSWPSASTRWPAARRRSSTSPGSCCSIARPCAGCTLFQRYYFCRPATRTAKALLARRLAYLNLFSAVHDPELTILQLENFVKRDVSLTMRGLRSVNSAAFAIRQPITSVRHALVMLGLNQVRQMGLDLGDGGSQPWRDAGGRVGGAAGCPLVRDGRHRVVRRRSGRRALPAWHVLHSRRTWRWPEARLATTR